MTQTKRGSLAESLANLLVGILLSQIVLACFGLPTSTAGKITLVMILVSTARSYFLRRIFNARLTA